MGTIAWVYLRCRSGVRYFTHTDLAISGIGSIICYGWWIALTLDGGLVCLDWSSLRCRPQFWRGGLRTSTKTPMGQNLTHGVLALPH
jgi:hypothetical protein